jgi:diaminopimelate decarboxylase
MRTERGFVPPGHQAAGGCSGHTARRLIMQHFSYRNGELCAEQVPLSEVAGRFGTPCYVYSRAAIESGWQSYRQAFAGRSHLICYAVKANSNIAVLNLLAQLGSGFDIVSGGELERVLRAGGSPDRVIFSGVGKQRREMRQALEAGIKCFNVESRSELERLNRVAEEAGRIAPVALRINPDVDAVTHPYIATGLNSSKFGIHINDALQAYAMARMLKNIRVIGIDCHIGSQITGATPHIDAVKRLLLLVDQLETSGFRIEHIDAGGGLGIRYRDEDPPPARQLVKMLCETITDPEKLIIIEPGRSIVGNAGVLLSRIEYLKENSGKNFIVLDAAMNDLLRPALYNAWQEILPVAESSAAPIRRYDVVGPVCETGDFLGLDRELAVRMDDLLVICSAGAYGFSMSSNYNSRPRAAEVLIDGAHMHEIRRRETVADLMNGESLLRSVSALK